MTNPKPSPGYDLKPCPFCGKRAYRLEHGDYGCIYAYCKVQPRAYQIISNGKFINDAMDDWNTRKHAPESSGLVPYNQFSPEMQRQRQQLKDIIKKHIDGSSCRNLGHSSDIDKSCGEILSSGFRKFEYAPSVPSVGEIVKVIKHTKEYGEFNDEFAIAQAIKEMLDGKR